MRTPSTRTCAALVALMCLAGLPLARSQAAAAVARPQPTAVAAAADMAAGTVKAPPLDAGMGRWGSAAGAEEPQYGAHYFYAAGYSNAVADGTEVRADITRPYLAPGDAHTLFEVAAQSADGQQIVEVGWTVDPDVNGDDLPHLFVYHWVDRQTSCYNGCGFVQVHETITAGMTLPSETSSPQPETTSPQPETTSPQPETTTSRRFAIEHRDDRWWVGYDGVWFGYFPDALWQGRFTQTGRVLWFGEVAAAAPTPCTDMGTGVLGHDPAAAEVSEIMLLRGGIATAPARVSRHGPTPALYHAESVTVRPEGAAFRYGGPGAC